MQGCLLGGGSIPIAAIVLWNGTSTTAAVWSPIIGLASGLIGWLVATSIRSGSVSVATTGDATNSLVGDCISLGMGGLSVLVLSLLIPNRTTEVVIGEVLDDVQNPSAASAKQPESKRDTSSGAVESGQSPRPLIVEQSDAAEELKPVTEEPYVPQNALSPQEVRSQKRLALMSLTIGTLGFCIVSHYPPFWESSTYHLADPPIHPVRHRVYFFGRLLLRLCVCRIHLGLGERHHMRTHAAMGKQTRNLVHCRRNAARPWRSKDALCRIGSQTLEHESTNKQTQLATCS